VKIDPFGSVQNVQQQPVPPPPTPPAGPPPQGDRVTLEDTRLPDRARQVQRDVKTGLIYTQEATQSGVHTSRVQSQQQTDFKVTLPKGSLLPANLEIEGSVDNTGKVNVVAHPEGQQGQAFPAQLTPDGKISVLLGANGPLAIFDSNTLDYGLATVPKGNPYQQQTDLKELIHPDASHTVIANEQTTYTAMAGPPRNAGFFGSTPQPTAPPVVRDSTYIQVDDRGGQVTAKRVQARWVPGQQQQSMSTGMKVGAFALLGPLALLIPGMTAGQGSYQNETPAPVTRQQDGTFVVGQPTLTDNMMSAAKRPFSFNSPLVNAWNTRNVQPDEIKPFSAYGPQALFAAFAAATPAAAAALQTPAK